MSIYKARFKKVTSVDTYGFKLQEIMIYNDAFHYSSNDLNVPSLITVILHGALNLYVVRNDNQDSFLTRIPLKMAHSSRSMLKSV
jgi:hypothetical protein